MNIFSGITQAGLFLLYYGGEMCDQLLSTGIPGQAFIFSLSTWGRQSTLLFRKVLHNLWKEGANPLTLGKTSMHFFFFSFLEGQVGRGISHSTDSWCFSCRFLCQGDSNSLITLYSKRLRSWCVHLNMKQDLLDPWSEWGRVLCVWSLWPPPVLFWKLWLLQGVPQTTVTFTPKLCFTKETGAKQHHWKYPHMISGFNLESGAGLWKRWEGNFSCPGDFVCFSVS